MNIVTYEAKSAGIKPEHSWVAYIVLPNGDYLGIMFRDYTETGAVAKATAFWEEESKKRYISAMADDDEADVKSIVYSQRGKHAAGKVWMRHKEHGLKRVDGAMVAGLISEGWYKSGPRSS